MKRTATQTEIAAFERRIRELMAEGYSVRFAVYQAYKEHPVMQTLQREVAAQIRAEAERGYGAPLPQGITDRLFTHSWAPDGLTLSARTTQGAILVRELVARTISEQIKKSASYRQASLAIFDGYKMGGVIPVQDVPKYLAQTIVVARHAGVPRDEMMKMLRPIRRQIEKGTTAGMRAAYSQLVDALEAQNEKALNKAIYVATQERTRYFADRIARTEMARAYQDGFLLRWDNNDDCVAYQWKLSGRHPRYDICDLYAKANLYGMGAGVFPKDKVPRLPAHPHCMCFLKPVIRGMIDNEMPIARIEEGGREYLDSVDLHHRQMLLGIHGAKDVMDGKISWTQKARGYGGKKVDSRLSQEGAKSGKIDIEQELRANATKLQATMSSTDYDEYINLLKDNDKIAPLYKHYADSIATVRMATKGGHYEHQTSTLVWGYPEARNIAAGMHKYHTLAHEYGHFFDRCLSTSKLTFKELDAVNAGVLKISDYRVSFCDEFLAAMRADKVHLRKVVTSAVKEEFRANAASAGVQDAIDGLFVNSRIYWGHGESYYNYYYNHIKKWKYEKLLKQVYDSLGFDVSSQAKVKAQCRIYQAASEAWANITSAVTCGGEDLEYVKQYLPHSYQAFMEILEKVTP